MKKILTALLIFAAGISAFCALRSATSRLAQAASADRQAWMAQTQTIVHARSEQVRLQERLKDLGQDLSSSPKPAASDESPALVASRLKNLSPAQSEQLLAELGFNWNSTGDYLVVSKDSLRAISLDGMKGTKLADVACQVLAITPEERGTLETLTQQLGADYEAWARSHVQRSEPTGDVVAKYAMPMDATFGQSLSNRFTHGISATLGPERADLLRTYSYDWMADLGMFGGEPTTMTVKRYMAGDTPRLNVEIRRDRGTMSTDVSPYQSFPESFRPLFPAGWPELARREGFELPQEFSKKQ